MNHDSPSNSEAKTPRPWLRAHHEARRKRTVELVQGAVDRLVLEKQTVTIEAICRMSKEIDPQGKGIKKAGVLGNAEAHAYYQKHSSSYQMAQGRKHHSIRKGHELAQLPRIDSDRDVNRVRQRYLKRSRADLVERLLSVEQAYAQLQLQLAHLQFEMIELQMK
jgi:hypothetical protein